MSKTLKAVLGTGIAIAAVGFTQRWITGYGELNHAILTQPDVSPGAWYCYYLGDYMTDHPGTTVVHSSPLELRDGSFVWATNTPEWDRLWFEKRGHEFPAKWTTYDELQGLGVEMTTMGS